MASIELTAESHFRTVRTVMFFITSAVCIVISAPMLIYFMYKFTRYKNTIIMKKRYPGLIYLILIGLIFICFRIPFSVLVHTPSSLPYVEPAQESAMATYIEAIVSVYILHLVTTLVCLRFWMVRLSTRFY